MVEINGISAGVTKGLEVTKKDYAKKENAKINTMSDEQSKSIFGAKLEKKFDIDGDGKINADKQSKNIFGAKLEKN